jgi:HAD superfamily hydrolase (TIGR01509 family)
MNGSASHIESALAWFMTDFDLIIFDCDGVLVDSEVLSCQCLSDLLGRHGVKTDADSIFEQFVGRSTKAVAGHFAALGRAMPQDFSGELSSRIRESFAQALRSIPGVETVLRGLDVPYCLASSSDIERIGLSLSLTGLSAFFEGRVFTSQMVRRGKPAPDLFLYAAQRLNVPPGRVLVIEDSVSGIEAGKAAGMTAWGFIGGSHYASRDGRALLMAAGADRVFDRMVDFGHCGPSHGV